MCLADDKSRQIMYLSKEEPKNTNYGAYFEGKLKCSPGTLYNSESSSLSGFQASTGWQTERVSLSTRRTIEFSTNSTVIVEISIPNSRANFSCFFNLGSPIKYTQLVF